MLESDWWLWWEYRVWLEYSQQSCFAWNEL
jgi:hypothetical protein